MIKSVMTPFPYFVDMDASLSSAKEIMTEHGISHLPVIEKGRLANVITQEEISRGMNANAPGADGRHQCVRDVCKAEAYIVELTERLDVVLLHMARTHIDCALVVKHGRLAGIFTIRDACRCFGEWLRSQWSGGNGHDAA